MTPGYEWAEAEIRHELITPLLRRIAHSISTMDEPPGCAPGSTYSSALHFETKTQEWPHVPGVKPRVEYLLTGQKEGKVLYLIPVEVKRRNTLADMGLLAHYMSSLGKSRGLVEGNTCVAYLLDGSSVHFAFAPYTSKDGLYLPIVLVSLRRTGTSIDTGTCVAMCLLQALSMSG